MRQQQILFSQFSNTITHITLGEKGVGENTRVFRIP